MNLFRNKRKPSNYTNLSKDSVTNKLLQITILSVLNLTYLGWEVFSFYSCFEESFGADVLPQWLRNLPHRQGEYLDGLFIIFAHFREVMFEFSILLISDQAQSSGDFQMLQEKRNFWCEWYRLQQDKLEKDIKCRGRWGEYFFNLLLQSRHEEELVDVFDFLFMHGFILNIFSISVFWPAGVSERREQ